MTYTHDALTKYIKDNATRIADLFEDFLREELTRRDIDHHLKDIEAKYGAAFAKSLGVPSEIAARAIDNYAKEATVKAFGQQFFDSIIPGNKFDLEDFNATLKQNLAQSGLTWDDYVDLRDRRIAQGQSPFTGKPITEPICFASDPGMPEMPEFAKKGYKPPLNHPIATLSGKPVRVPFEQINNGDLGWGSHELVAQRADGMTSQKLHLAACGWTLEEYLAERDRRLGGDQFELRG